MMSIRDIDPEKLEEIEDRDEWYEDKRPKGHHSREDAV